MKKSVKRIVSLVSAIAMLSTTAAVASAAYEVNELKDVNTAVATTTTDFSKVNADAYVITSATAEMEKAALEILKDQVGAVRADQEAILDAVANMTTEEVKAAMESTTAAMEANETLKAAVDKAVADVKTTLANGAGSDADFVVSNVYNPINYIQGGATVEAAKAAVQVYVDEVNAKLEAAAKEAGAKIADVSNIEPETKITTADIANGAEVANTLEAVFEEQAVAKSEEISAVEVVQPAVTYKYGDLNNDQKVKAVDLVIMLQYELGIVTDAIAEEKGYTIAAGDVAKDGSACDAADLVRLKLFLLEDIAEGDLGKIVG
ncbi:MAG: hypothetical protein E7510_09635 [Ruminococcus sp.]|nr:hypothetical protein [Ruminococcus sp.]